MLNGRNKWQKNIILFQQLWLSHLSYADAKVLLHLALTLGGSGLELEEL